MKNTKIILVCFVISITIMSCYTKKRLSRLVTPNPTTYVFNASIEQIEESIDDAFGNNLQMKCMVLCWNGGDMGSFDYIYKNLKNVNDAILYPVCNRESKIYYRFGEPAPYNVSFHLHLESISEHKTKVEIFTLEPKIVLFEIGIAAIHFGFEWRKKVPSSTVEEYEILLAIGKQLKEKGMPACNYPEKWLKYREKHPSVGKRW